MSLRHPIRCVPSNSLLSYGRLLRPSSRTSGIQALRLNRRFHASRPNHLVAEALQLSEAAFQQVHNLSGLSWGLSIPLTAVAFRLAWLPILYVTNRANKQEQKVAGVLKGWRKAYQDRARMKYPQGTDQSAQLAESWVQTQLRTKLKDIQRHTTYMSWQSRLALQFSFLPIWFINAQVVRSMSGDDRTLLSVFTKSGEDATTTVIPPEPGLASESFLWLPDLVQFDHTWVLPLTFAALSGASIWQMLGKDIKQRQSKIVGMDQGWARTREVWILMISQLFAASPFVFGYLIIRGEMPSAVVLYLIGSVGMQMVQRPFVRYTLGINKSMEVLETRVPKPKGQKDTPRNT
ncbi:uncharacterized protein PV06_01957 [Exophiala oligosperma]|uniref:Uncharacterized protein n=2 Tax=Chaetothyriales TaxID=34395 RepID=A0A0D2B268_9EURO|nr:uncharacterized protein PV06_01957 [Exophiala oligosperma]KAJ9646127.1 hypothetical protein H2204_000789 [Knufia peltigerae]KIW46276.1 hypothetical protein PV06_01957 [Exophiala oligosperma]